MPFLPKWLAHRFAVAAAIVTLFGATALAQQADEVPEPEEEEAEVIEEIIVVAPRPGSRKRLDIRYEDPMRARLLKDLYEMQEIDKEMAWREAGKSSDGVKWGYDPRDDYHSFSELDTTLGPDSDRTKPATLFKFEF